MENNNLKNEQQCAIHDVRHSVYVFRCLECNFRERIPINNDADMDIQDYLDKQLTSSGCHQGCGTMRWGIYDKNGYNVV